jgi:hypothetical protein
MCTSSFVVSVDIKFYIVDAGHTLFRWVKRPIGGKAE